MAFIDIYGLNTIELSTQPAPLDVTDTHRSKFVNRQFPLGAYFDRTAGWLPPTKLAIARFLSRLQRRVDAMKRNMDPRFADELLDEWESAFGVEVVAGSTLADRRQAVLAQVRALGGNTAAYYEGVATDFGYGDAVVTDAASPFVCTGPCTQALMGGEWKLTFVLTAASQGATRDQLLVNLINGQLLAGWFAVYDFT